MRSCLILALLASAACAIAQSLEVSYDLALKRAIPNASFRVTELRSFLGVKGFNPQLFGFAGLDQTSGVLGGGVRTRVRVAENLHLVPGVWAIVAQGSRPRLGLYLGVQLEP